ncbi:ThiF family adenylyltransferase [Tessaracoccus rhinocerotis]|uniref:ThiF family adenylyltransferase n=1 Tax=Tessaracoccus rhinocerotis TaxID=1689449 RepID=A0A553K3Z6_9ACTN|nr:ThiF family adenylyltransferase [Tessaracoccus rhinocerotis]TRY19404.1 ThiF family adenylyltransferase [Tessaracoccus rhinocerotis]
MYRSDPFVILTHDGAAKIANSEMRGGRVAMRHTPSEDAYIVDVVETAKDVRVQVAIPPEYTALKWGDALHAAQWMRQPVEGLNLHHLAMIRRPGISLAFHDFRSLVAGVNDPGNQLGLLITYDPDLSQEAIEVGVSTFAGWLVQRSGVRPIHIEVEPETVGLAQLTGAWPIEQLARHAVLVVGCGSIGGVAAEALAGYGVGTVELVDPDRFLWHNIIRHTLGPESVGRYKVDALKTHLDKRWPDQDFVAHRLDAVSDAHFLRSLIPKVDLVLCAADGIAPRRVVSHLSRRAGKPAVLACVLDHGSVGEIIRLRPTPRFGCLLCLRENLQDEGAMDAEADQELDYGIGRVHQPMTAVSPDLQYVGTLAAKTAVATLLESLHGDHTQRLPGEHAILGLRPTGDLASPFDVREAGDIRWRTVPSPRPDCPTCSAA